MNAFPSPLVILLFFSSLLPSACESHKEEGHEEHHEAVHKIVATQPIEKDVVSTEQYVCQIHSRRHIEVRALERGYLQQINVKEGQSVKQGDVLFRIAPVLYQANLDTEIAEAEVAEIKYKNTLKLSKQSIVSNQELALAKAELARAQARVKRALAELNFTSLRAPFDGIIDRQYEQQGSLVEDGGILTTMSDNKVMWVYFNVPEAKYLEYKARQNNGLEIELRLANGELFPHKGKIGAIEADFNNETGNIAFRADFPNPEGLLRHGQTGTILVHRPEKDAIVIPQRATYEILAKKYVYVLEPATGDAPAHASEHAATPEHEDEHEPAHVAAESDHGGAHATGDEAVGIVRQREIVIKDEMDDIFVISKGLEPGEKIIFEGIRSVRDGDRVEYELRSPEVILGHLKYHAE